MKNTAPLIGAIGLVGVVAAVAILSTPAESTSHIAAEIGAQIGAVPGPLSTLNTCTIAVDSNPDGGTDLVTCSGSAGYVEIFCENQSSTPVKYGSRTANLASLGPRICNDTATCGRDAFRLSVRNGQLGASTSSGTATLHCTEGR